VRSDPSLACDEIIQYPESTDRGYPFSLFGFPQVSYGTVLAAYFAFCADYERHHGYRTDLADVGYRIAKDQQSLLSYSYDSDMLTIDPVSTGNEGWKTFLGDYNEWCSNRNGVPLLNQTFGVTEAIAKRAFGDRLGVISATRKKYDPTNRLLNDYFKELFGA